ncbi:uncharacterized protein LOC144155013 isoform X2 [Haemaphysalis longicornis]
MASNEEHEEPAAGSSDGSDDDGSIAGSLAGPDSPEAPDNAPEEVAAVAERTSEDAAVEEAPEAAAPSHSPGGCNEGVVESEEEGAVHSPEPTPQLHLSKDTSRDALGAHSAVPMAQKCLNSRSMEPLEGELDFEDDAPPESPSSTSIVDKAPDKETKAKGEKLEEGEADDDGEVSDVSGTELSAPEDDLEEGELPEGTGGTSGAGTGRKSSAPRPICRFFNKGQCTWGSSCRFIHPGINDRGNYNMFASGPKPQQHHHMPPPMGGGPAGVMRGGAPPPDFLGPPMPPMAPDDMMLPPVESAWERGLRHAKELMKRASRRKEQEPDFEEKRLNLVPPHHDRTPTQAEMDKENDFYGASAPPPPSRGMSPPYVRPPVPPPAPPHPSRGGRRADGRREEFYGFEEGDPLEHSEREAREYWRGGRYENFEVRWSNRQDFDHRDRREKERRLGGRSYDREKSGYSHGPRPDRPHGGGPERDPRWREERFPDAPPPPTARSRPDEWRDPWRRSKTPKGRRSRSRGRNRRSFSNCSSRSFSSRSSRSSYSYSRSSSSRSSYSSYDSRSRSRSPAPNAAAGRPRGNQPASRGPPPYAPPSQAPAKQAGGGNTGPTGGPPVGRSPVLDRRKPYNPSPPPVTTPASPPRKSRRKGPSPVTGKQKKSRSGSFSGSSSRSRSRSSSSRSPSRSRSQSFSRSPSLNSVSSASSSPSRRRGPGPTPAAKPPLFRARNPSPPKKVPESSKKRMEKDPLAKGSAKVAAPPPPPAAPAVVMPSYREPLQPTLDLGGFDEELAQRQAREALLRQQGINPKPQIKLTLIKKTLPLALPKKEEPTVKNNGDKGAKKRPASPKMPASPSPPPSGRKSATLRREELLKQLKAVEDAIARKRAKFS